MESDWIRCQLCLWNIGWPLRGTRCLSVRVKGTNRKYRVCPSGWDPEPSSMDVLPAERWQGWQDWIANLQSGTPWVLSDRSVYWGWAPAAASVLRVSWMSTLSLSSWSWAWTEKALGSGRDEYVAITDIWLDAEWCLHFLLELQWIKTPKEPGYSFWP